MAEATGTSRPTGSKEKKPKIIKLDSVVVDTTRQSLSPISGLGSDDTTTNQSEDSYTVHEIVESYETGTAPIIDKDCISMISETETVQDYQKPKKSKKLKDRVEQTFVGPLATICPGEQFTFTVTDETKETPDLLVLGNTSDRYIAFKVKTTTPDSYRVRPSTGLIPPKSNIDIHIYLQPGHTNVTRDKFLVMVMDVGDEASATSNKIAELWKIMPKDPARYMEHRLWCSRAVSMAPMPTTTTVHQGGDQLAELTRKVERVLQNQERLELRLSQVFTCNALLLLLLIIVVIVLVSSWSLIQSNKSDQSDNSCNPYYWTTDSS